jgi:hypothetical protein
MSSALVSWPTKESNHSRRIKLVLYKIRIARLSFCPLSRAEFQMAFRQLYVYYLQGFVVAHRNSRGASGRRDFEFQDFLLNARRQEGNKIVLSSRGPAKN